MVSKYENDPDKGGGTVTIGSAMRRTKNKILNIYVSERERMNQKNQIHWRRTKIVIIFVLPVRRTQQ